MLLWAYVDAEKMRSKIKRDYDNQLAWLSGLYVRNAVGSILGDSEYPEAIDFVEMDRWNKLTQTEKNKELQAEAVNNSMTQMERVRVALKSKMKDGE